MTWAVKTDGVNDENGTDVQIDLTEVKKMGTGEPL